MIVKKHGECKAQLTDSTCSNYYFVKTSSMILPPSRKLF